MTISATFNMYDGKIFASYQPLETLIGQYPDFYSWFSKNSEAKVSKGTLTFI